MEEIQYNCGQVQHLTNLKRHGLKKEYVRILTVPVGEFRHGSCIEHLDGDGETVLELVIDYEEGIVVAVPLVGERNG